MPSSCGPVLLNSNCLKIVGNRKLQNSAFITNIINMYKTLNTHFLTEKVFKNTSKFL